MSDHAFFVLPVNGSRIVRFDSAQRPGFEYPGSCFDSAQQNEFFKLTYLPRINQWS